MLPFCILLCLLNDYFLEDFHYQNCAYNASFPTQATCQVCNNLDFSMLTIVTCTEHEILNYLLF
jgi:hypothetical protein